MDDAVINEIEIAKEKCNDLLTAYRKSSEKLEDSMSGELLETYRCAFDELQKKTIEIQKRLENQKHVELQKIDTINL